MAYSKAPSIVCVPGGLHVAKHFDPLTKILKAEGYTVVVNNSADPRFVPGGAQNYIDGIREDIESQVLAGKDVVLVLHSLGGVTGSMAVKGLAKTDASKPGVKRIVAVSAILAGVGQTVFETVGQNCALWLEVKDGMLKQFPWDHPGDAPTTTGVVEVAPQKVLYNDLTEVQQREAYDLMIPSYLDCWGLAPDYVGWSEVPLTYIVCERDLAIFPEVQENIIAKTGVDVTVKRIDGSHSAFISKPRELADLIIEASKA